MDSPPYSSSPQPPTPPTPPFHPQPSYPPQQPAAPGYTPPGYVPPGYVPPGYRAPSFSPVRPPRKRGGGLRWLVIGLFLTPVIACAVLLAASAITRPALLARNLPFFSVRVSGVIYGEDATQREAGREVMIPLAGASVTCGGASAITDNQGRYSLSQLRGGDYTCSVSAAQYSAATASIHPQLSGSYTLDFGSPGDAAAGATCAPVHTGQHCGALTLQAGSISGVVLDSATRKPVNSATISCWDNTLAERSGQKASTRYTVVAGAQGQYLLTNAPVGPYLCVAEQSAGPQPVVAHPNAVSTLDFSVCESHCRGVSYHSGDVMQTFTGYVIFWTPPGKHLDPSGGDARFRSLVAQYLNDVGGTPFYNLLTQYWDASGPVRNVARLGGTYVDTRAYPHAGTRADPLNEADIYHEIELDIESQHWPLKPGVGFAVITGYGIQTCATLGGQRSCSFPLSNDTGYCAYHSSTDYTNGSSTTDYFPYMLIANVPACAYLPTFSQGPAPYGDPVADAAIDSISHEQFEMVSNPGGGGWYDKNDNSEIADKCETSFGAPASDGSNVRLANGHGYALQREWNSASSSCAYR